MSSLWGMPYRAYLISPKRNINMDGTDGHWEIKSFAFQTFANHFKSQWLLHLPPPLTLKTFPNKKFVCLPYESHNNPCNYTVAAGLSDWSTLWSLWGTNWTHMWYSICQTLCIHSSIKHQPASIFFSSKKLVSMHPAILDS